MIFPFLFELFLVFINPATFSISRDRERLEHISKRFSKGAKALVVAGSHPVGGCVAARAPSALHAQQVRRLVVA